MRVAATEAVTVVINLCMLRTPNDIDREIGGEAEAHRSPQALRPLLDRTERCLRPVPVADHSDQLTAAGEPIGRLDVMCDGHGRQVRVLHSYVRGPRSRRCGGLPSFDVATTRISDRRTLLRGRSPKESRALRPADAAVR